MAEPIVIPAGGGEVIGDAPDRRVEILSDADPLHATWSRFGPRREGADLHVHRRHSDVFYVLDGELTVRLGVDDEQVPVAAGTLAEAPPLVVHGFRNGSDEEVRYLNFHAPGEGFADYMRGLSDFDQHDPPEDGGRPVSEASFGRRELVDERPGVRVDLLVSIETIAVAEVRAAAGVTAQPRHAHDPEIESLFVLDGTLGLETDAGSLHVATGSWVRIPAGCPHAFSFPEPVRFLVLHTPNAGVAALV